MKRLFFILSLSVCLISTSAFAGNPVALQSFYQNFSSAHNVTWTNVNGLTKISFILNEKEMFAYYEGTELVVLATQISQTQLPQSLQNDLKKKYSECTVSGIFQCEKDGSTQYFISLDNAKKHLTLTATSKSWSVFQSERKRK
jgi:hypothetical protein